MTKKTYTVLLNVLALTAIICISMLVVMSDVNEEREPFEFVQVHNTK